MAQWRTAENVRYIWHGEWADAELEFDGCLIDEHSIEDFVCGEMKDEGLDYNDDNIFYEWIGNHQGLIEQTIIEFSESYYND